MVIYAHVALVIIIYLATLASPVPISTGREHAHQSAKRRSISISISPHNQEPFTSAENTVSTVSPSPPTSQVALQHAERGQYNSTHYPYVPYQYKRAKVFKKTFLIVAVLLVVVVLCLALCYCQYKNTSA